MGEPWLDSLSEDWNSEPKSSSPASSLANSKNGTQHSKGSQSRIPHLAHRMRQDSSSNSSFLKPRSARGRARSQGIPVLSERSASSLNLPSPDSRDYSSKRKPSVTLPRRASSNFSDSQRSVQHHSVRTSPKDTPEWKRRLQKGEDIASDGFDLFSPSKLEGMFSQPAQPTATQDDRSLLSDTNAKPWTSLKVSNLPTNSDQFSSFRASRLRAPVMECLIEENEDEEERKEEEMEIGQEQEHSMSAISSDLVRDGAMHGLVKRRVSNYEQPHKDENEARQNDDEPVSHISKDPRWRTLSGQQEMRNEYISPLTASAKNTVSERALQQSAELDPKTLKEKLMEAALDHSKRPSSSSSDRDISYNGQRPEDDTHLNHETLEDMTSHSLPEDLSMGTQDLVSHGGFVNARRGPGSNETSFLHKRLSSIKESSETDRRPSTAFRSSPPPYNHSTVEDRDQDKSSSSLLSPSADGSVLHHEPSPERPTSAGSPLKLFGNRDTYTNNKLLRVLSQYEDVSAQSQSPHDSRISEQEFSKIEEGFGMSQFGRGELDTFHFEQQVERPSTTQLPPDRHVDKIFQSFGDLSIQDEGTTYSSRPARRNSKMRDATDPNIKRLPSSPAKDRTPKRRRTLVRDEIVVEDLDIEIKVNRLSENMPLAGRKRKDAKPGEGGEPAQPEVLATRAILRPRAGSRKSSDHSVHMKSTENSTIKDQTASGELAEALAAELASFAQGASEAHHDSRKPSLATKDYMEEANKVMEFIRARGKPKSRLPEIQEPLDSSELDADRILDLEIDEDSTQEPFSRPPSREGPVKPREDRRIAKHDPRVASHLQKFKDSDELDIIASTSIIGTLHLVDNKAPAEAAPSRPNPTTEQESSPPNIRIRSGNDAQRNRRDSDSLSRGHISTQKSSTSSGQRTFATDTSGSSGQKGMIASGTVSIPEQVGTMTFDREKQIWTKQQIQNQHRKKSQSQQSVISKHDEATLEDDPFASIPDLSIDEQQEAALRVVQASSSRPSTSGTVQQKQIEPEQEDSELVRSQLQADESEESPFRSSIRNEAVEEKAANVSRRVSSQIPASLRSEASKHEAKLYEGLPSRVPVVSGTLNKQARVVTIAFSSPVASEIPGQKYDSVSSIADDDNDFLPPEDSDDDTEYLKTPQTISKGTREVLQKQVESSPTNRMPRELANRGLNQRPVSRIAELDECENVDGCMSLMRIQEPQAVTPRTSDKMTVAKPLSAYKGTSILCLTPLSDFTMHQADKANHPEESFVQQRAHPKALLQAHGALTLSVDTLVKAITDSQPEELFWEQLRSLSLKENKLPSVHGLQDYCSNLEELDMSNNLIAQLDGLPTSLRKLNASGNCLNDFTSWSFLSNLQYVDVSGNELQNLEAFSSLVHIRGLRARKNKIRDIEGIVDLDGLISLDLRSNQLERLDFEGVDLPRIEELDLTDNKLVSVSNLHCLPRLRKLNLGGNKLQALQVSEPLYSLESLVLSGNRISSLDLSMFPALRDLDLDNNCITTLEGLSGTKTLRRLSVRNQHDSVDLVDTILTTPNECEEVYLSSNVLSQRQLKLPHFPHYNLRSLDLAACGLRELPRAFGDYFPNCRDLNLNFNAISDLSPLVGDIKLQNLYVTSNRIKRLRRTCLALARMPDLERVDIRNNPLTVGFYAPESDQNRGKNPYLLPNSLAKEDSRWLQLIDETTILRRRMVELLLAQNCQKLVELDGLRFPRSKDQGHDTIWSTLTSKGVLVRTIQGLAPQPSMSFETQQQKEHTVGYEGAASGNDVIDELNTIGTTIERSIMVE